MATTMEDKILETIKKSLGVDPETTVFDPEIVIHLNSALADLNQLGIGPTNGFEVEEDGDETWSDFLDDDLKLSSVKTFIHLSVKLIFDPPPNSWVVNAYKDRLNELTWRINVAREDQIPPVELDGEVVLDGGGA